MEPETPIDQPLCKTCRNFNGGAGERYKMLMEMHGQTPVVACGTYIPLEPGEDAGKEGEVDGKSN